MSWPIRVQENRKGSYQETKYLLLQEPRNYGNPVEIKPWVDLVNWEREFIVNYRELDDVALESLYGVGKDTIEFIARGIVNKVDIFVKPLLLEGYGWEELRRCVVDGVSVEELYEDLDKDVKERPWYVTVKYSRRLLNLF